MDGMNRVTLFGNLGADPELRMTSGGQAVLKLRLATTESFLTKDKQRSERTEWHNVVIWGKRAEALSKFLKKGDRALIEGSLRTDSYDDRDGKKQYRTEVVAREVCLAGGRPLSRPRSENESAESMGPGASSDGFGMSDDDVPF